MNELFFATLNQMAFLFAFIMIGFVLVKLGCLTQQSAISLSKLENNLFVPALIFSTFIENFTIKTFKVAGNLLCMSLLLAVVTLPLTVWIVKKLFKEEFQRKLTTYALHFSNFGFMGNAVVSAIFPSVFTEYIIFTIPFWTLAYVWGVPTLLIPAEGNKTSLKNTLKRFFNPMFVCILVGAIIGLIALPVPSFILSVAKASGSCMSPIAMLLTGVMVAKLDLKSLFKHWKNYLVAGCRLVLYPLLFLAVFCFLPRGALISETFLICGLCIMAMPTGMTAVFTPAAYGKDTTLATEFTLVTHLLSLVTIPLIVTLLQYLL